MSRRNEHFLITPRFFLRDHFMCPMWLGRFNWPRYIYSKKAGPRGPGFDSAPIRGKSALPQIRDVEIAPPSAVSADLLDQLVRFGGFPEPFPKADTRFYNRWRRFRTERDPFGAALLSLRVPGRAGSSRPRAPEGPRRGEPFGHR
jgi:hypothetical protein